MDVHRAVSLLERGSLWLLLSAHVLAYFLLRADLETAQVFCEALFFAQVSLLASWAVLGPGPPLVRWPACGVLALLLCWSADMIFFQHQVVIAPVVISLCTLSIFLSCWRARGFFVLGDDGAHMPAAGFRFSIRDLLAITAIAAVVIALGMKARAALVARWSVIPVDLLIGAIGITSGMLGAATLWSLLCPGRLAWRIAALAAAALALGFVVPYICGLQTGPAAKCLLWLSLQAAVLCGSLGVVRLCGYRLIKPRSPPANPAPAFECQPSGVGPI